ncbi:MAG TPA: LysM peptidoglycan-binding domain-containing protein [Candidatus Polarisedimenticolaceae bacterium]|nr:LysM peptidoglycan-binding domain-containing protein [Candidatus Polarisedimenticolaceae bacterium]
MEDKKPDFSNVVGGSSSTAKPPSPSPSRAPSTPAMRTYTVKSGDSLWKIAQHFYGKGNAWTRIHEANRDVIQNPDLIQPGWTLRIPE